MGIIKHDEIVGVHEETGKILCRKHMGPVSGYGEEDFILEPDLQRHDDLYYCDECGKTL